MNHNLFPMSRKNPKQYYLEHKELYAQRALAWKKKNPEKAKEKDRRAQLKRYGITPEEYESMLKTQDYKCAICRTTDPKQGKRTDQSFSVDHNHTTGQVRGLLCFNCNTAVGKLQDDPNLIRAAADYIEKTDKSALRLGFTETTLAQDPCPAQDAPTG